MNRQNRQIALFLGLSTLLGAVEIPVQDLSNEEINKNISSPSYTPSSTIPKALPVHTEPLSQARSTTKPPIKPPAKLELALHELQLLRSAAQAAGGDIEVTIRPTGGISAEDLVLPLSKSGAFIVKPGKSTGSIRIESKNIDGKSDSKSVPSSEKQLSTPSTPTHFLNPKSPSTSTSASIPTLILK